MMAIKLRCKNDTNGNPRRVFVVFHAGRMIDAIDEGYSGYMALTSKYPEFAGKPIDEFDTTPTERRRLLKQFSK